MWTSNVLQQISSATAIGLSCGSCCTPSISIFLSTYIMTHASNIKKSVFAFLNFCFGKTVAIVIGTVCASLLGGTILQFGNQEVQTKLSMAIKYGYVVVGIVLLLEWCVERKRKKRCKNCYGSCKKEGEKRNNIKQWPPFAVGVLYGLSPCAPFLMLLAYAATVSIGNAFLVGITFSIVSTVSPTILCVLLTGAMSKRLYEELPKYMDAIRLVSYLVFIGIGVGTL